MFKKKVNEPIDKPLPSPRTIGQAREYIEQTFKEQQWDAREQAYYMRRHGLKSINVDQLPPDDTRRLLKAMQTSRMILIDERKNKAN